MAISSGTVTQCAVTTTTAVYLISESSDHNMAWLYNEGSVVVHYKVGGSSETAAKYDGSSPPVGDSIVPPNAIKEIWMGEDTYLAVITDSSTSTVHVEPFSERIR